MAANDIILINLFISYMYQLNIQKKKFFFSGYFIKDYLKVIYAYAVNLCSKQTQKLQLTKRLTTKNQTTTKTLTLVPTLATKI